MDPKINLQDISLDQFDYDNLLKGAKELEKEGTLESLESCIRNVQTAINILIKEGDKNLSNVSDEPLLKELKEYEIRVYSRYHELKIKTLLERAKEEDKAKNYESAINIYKEVKEIMNDLNDLGLIKIDSDKINFIKRKISELTKNVLERKFSKNIKKVENQNTENKKFQEENYAEIIDLSDNKDKGKIINLEPNDLLFDATELSNINYEKLIDSQDMLDLEKLTSERRGINLSKIEKILESKNFKIFTVNDEFRGVYNLIDFITVKSNLIKKNLEVIHIGVIKFFDLYGTLIIDENEAKYNSNNENLTPIQLESLLGPFTINIKKIIHIISRDLGINGPFTEQLINFIDSDIYLEKFRFSKKGFFYRNQQVQYKFKIHPIIVSYNNVGFAERNIPYAYQSSNNLYVVKIDDLADLLDYIESKSSAIETMCIRTIKTLKLFLLFCSTSKLSFKSTVFGLKLKK